MAVRLILTTNRIFGLVQTVPSCPNQSHLYARDSEMDSLKKMGKTFFGTIYSTLFCLDVFFKK